jgi:hypothetical protein
MAARRFKLKMLFAGSAITARPFVRYIQAVEVLEAEADCPEKERNCRSGRGA